VEDFPRKATDRIIQACPIHIRQFVGHQNVSPITGILPPAARDLLGHRRMANVLLINAFRYRHHRVYHKETYLEGQKHTNTIKDFWSLLKRRIRVIHTEVSSK
jgi:hypothetical protein